MDDNVVSLAEAFAAKTKETKELLNQQMPEPKVDAMGVVNPMSYPDWLAEARMKLIRRVIVIHENTQTASFQCIENFCKLISEGEQNIEKAWFESTLPISKVDTNIDFAKIFEQAKSVGTPIPQLSAVGTVTKSITEFVEYIPGTTKTRITTDI